MKTRQIFGCLALLTLAMQSTTGYAQTSQNYIIESVARSPFNTVAELLAAPVGNVNHVVQYFDELGRPLQTIQRQASGKDKNDIIQHFEYDMFGREVKKFLPYVHAQQTGNYVSGGNANVFNFYKKTSGNDVDGIVRTLYPYEEALLERSPLGKLEEQGAPGAHWQPSNTMIGGAGHTKRLKVESSETGEVKYWTTKPKGAESTGSYDYSALYKTTLYDENNIARERKGSLEEFRDYYERLVLSRVWESETKSLDTYYVYDALGNLRYVLPPLVTQSIFTEDAIDPVFDKYIYAFHYDKKKRIVERKIPGKGWEYIVYNRNNQPILTQDSLQRQNHEWLFTKYDVHGRIVLEGQYVNDISRIELQNLVSQHNASIDRDYELPITSGDGYTNEVFPTVYAHYHNIYYYGRYDFPGNIFGEPLPDQASVGEVKTLLTGTKTTKLGTGDMLLSVSYYDKKGRLVKTSAQNHLGGDDIVLNEYNFVGDLKTSTRKHLVNGKSVTIKTSMDYDHTGRPLSTVHKINSQKGVRLTRNEYNEIGQLVGRQLGGDSLSGLMPEYVQLNENDIVVAGTRKDVVASASIVLKSGFHAQEGADFKASIVEEQSIQHIKYSYNERGWLNKQYSDDFEFELKYDSPTNGGTAQYNGNISEQNWKHSEQPERYISYNYDILNRLIEGNSPGYMVEQMKFDDLGNITRLHRADGHTSGTIAYDYSGNKLQAISGALTGSFLYDANGNATKDRTGMILVYNHMNLPVSVTGNGRTVNYLYDATGTKLRKTSSMLGQHDYVGGIEYKDGKINLIHTGEGTAHWVENGEKYVYQYHLKDHLGNVRSVIYRNPTTGFVELLQQDDYFPFGKRYVVRGGDNHYLYNGKEMQPELTGGTHLFGSSLSPEGQLDYGARFYDPEIGRWNVVDSLAGKFQSFSPYNYAVNNPMSFIDPDGKAISIAYHKKSQPFIFNGANHSQAPGHWKVQTFLQAYNYMIKNGTGSEIRQLAESKSIMVNLNVSATSERNYFKYSTHEIGWNPFIAKTVETNQRSSAILSPSTLLEHEAGHATGYYNNPMKYKNDGALIENYGYSSLEEYRIASTVEKRAAHANGEFFPGEMRSGYGSSKQDFWVKSPTSNGPQYLFEKVYYEIHGKSVQSYFPQLSIINTSPVNSMLYFQGK